MFLNLEGLNSWPNWINIKGKYEKKQCSESFKLSKKSSQTVLELSTQFQIKFLDWKFQNFPGIERDFVALKVASTLKFN